MIYKSIHIVGAITMGFLHVLFADILFFYGTVINPELIHKLLNTVAFFMTLPFSTLLFIPEIGQVFIFVQVAIVGFWIITYYWLIHKAQSVFRSCKFTRFICR